MDRPKDISVVGHCHGRHAQIFHSLAKLFDVTGAVEQGVVRVEVQVDELGHGFGAFSLSQEGQRKRGSFCEFRGRAATWGSRALRRFLNSDPALVKWWVPQLEKPMECRTKDELEQHLPEIRRLATSSTFTSDEKDAAVRAERFAIGLLREHDESGHHGKRCPFATRLG
jgi:hypothetical protein